MPAGQRTVAAVRLVRQVDIRLSNRFLVPRNIVKDGRRREF